MSVDDDDEDARLLPILVSIIAIILPLVVYIRIRVHFATATIYLAADMHLSKCS